MQAVEDLSEWEPTQEEPGSPKKQEILRQRVLKKQPLHHPDDLVHEASVATQEAELDFFLEVARKIEEETAIH